MIVWPASLPQRVLAQGYAETFPKTAVRTQMDAGPDKVRRRFTAAVRDFEVSLRLTPAQAATLESFFDSTTAGGALAFDWTHPRTGDAVSFRFKGAPRLTAVARGQRYQAALSLEILP